jgi:hypothetical protein
MKIPIQQRILGLLAKNSLVVVLIVVISVYLVFSAFFGLIYHFGNLVKDSLGNDHLNYPDCFYFSFITQATVGYGDLRPIGFGRFLTIFQILFGLIWIGTGMALLILKLLTPGKSSIVFEKTLVYDPRQRRFHVRFLNRLPVDLYMAKLEMRLRKERTTPWDGGKLSRIKITLFRDIITVIPSMVPFLTSTYPINPEEKLEEGVRILVPPDLLQAVGIIFVLTAQYYAGNVIATTEFTIENILCGHHASTYEKNPEVIDWSKWGVVDKSTQDDCKVCFFLDACPWKVE